MIEITDDALPAHIARQLAACEAMLPGMSPRHRPVAERAVLALKAARGQMDWGDASGARLTLAMGMAELLPAAMAAMAAQAAGA